MKNIIINADDFGLSQGICRSIHELFNKKAISSTSLMVAAPDAINIMKENGVKDLLGVAGVHLQLTNGTPLSPHNAVPSLFRLNEKKFKSLKDIKEFNPQEVKYEWRMQIIKACELLGGKPTHIDSHHGFHRIPELFDIYIELANEFQIPMRGAVGGEIRTRIETECIQASTAIVRDWTGKNLTMNDLINQLNLVIAENPKEQTIEIVCHPGYNDKYLESVSGLCKSRENDHEVLLYLANINWWKNSNYELVSFKSFPNVFNRCL